MGSVTLAGIWQSDVDAFKTALIGERTGFVRLLVKIKPEEREFLNGWLDRCYRW